MKELQESRDFNVFVPEDIGSGEGSAIYSGDKQGEYYYSGEGSKQGEYYYSGEESEDETMLASPSFLYTVRDSIYRVALITHPFYGVGNDLEDNYTCVAENEFGRNAVTVFLDVTGELAVHE